MRTEGHDGIDAIGPEGAELARYRVSDGERVLMGWRRDSGVEVSDRPLDLSRGGGHLVDRGFRCFEQLSAFVGDYLAQAALLDAVPMSDQGIGSMLDQTEGEALAPLLGEEA
jgi:hypothetical protein